MVVKLGKKIWYELRLSSVGKKRILKGITEKVKRNMTTTKRENRRLKNENRKRN
jgi:hypothetical protein